MSELKIKNADASDKYLGTMGAGSTGDPYFSIPADFYTEVAKGNVPGHTIVHKFGGNPAVGVTFEPITSLGIYNTPQVSGATKLRIKAGGDANDTAAGSGAREITIVGLDETGAEVTETLATAGASASTVTTATFIRFYRAYVSASGTYATASAGSHAATITIENGAGGTDWGAIDLNGFAKGQTHIGAYSVPLGKTAYLISYSATIESTKTTEVIFFQRRNILEIVAPYTAMREVFSLGTIAGQLTNPPEMMPIGPFPALTDIGYMARVASTSADVNVEFKILLVDD